MQNWKVVPLTPHPPQRTFDLSLSKKSRIVAALSVWDFLWGGDQRSLILFCERPRLSMISLDFIFSFVFLFSCGFLYWSAVQWTHKEELQRTRLSYYITKSYSIINRSTDRIPERIYGAKKSMGYFLQHICGFERWRNVRQKPKFTMLVRSDRANVFFLCFFCLIA